MLGKYEWVPMKNLNTLKKPTPPNNELSSVWDIPNKRKASLSVIWLDLKPNHDTNPAILYKP